MNVFFKNCLLIISLSLLCLTLSLVHAYSSTVETIIRVGYDGNLPPFQFVINNDPVGFHIDLTNEIAKMYNYKIEYVPISGNKNFTDALRNHEIDMVLGICPNPYILSKAVYSDSISESYITMVAGNSVAEEYLSDNKQKYYLANVEMNTVSYSFIPNMGKIRFSVQKNQKLAFEKFIAGESDILIGVRDSVLYQLDSINASDDYKIINNYIEPINYYIAVVATDKGLIHNINTGIQKLHLSGDYDEIRSKWINDQERIKKQISDTLVKGALAVFVVIATIIFFNLRLNHLLKLQVSEQTQEIVAVNKDLKQKLTELRENNEIRNKVVDQSPSAIVVVDGDFNITLLNEKTKELAHVTDDIIGENALNVDLLNVLLEDKTKQLQSEGMEFLGIEKHVPDTIEDDKVYRYDIYSLYTEDNCIRGAILVIDDVTDEIKLKNQAYEIEKNCLLNQMIAEITHEILNPLTSIKTFVELVPSKKDDPLFCETFDSIVPAEVDRINLLLKNLLDYAKTQKISKVSVDVWAIIHSCAKLIQPMISHDRIQISLDIATPSKLYIFADENQFKQILLNLMINSIESMHERLDLSPELGDLSLKIRINKTSKCVCILIKDQGNGMTPQQLEKATGPFYTTKPNGSGLGLAIAKRFVEENQGLMKIESHKGIGTSISLKFPINKEDDL